MSDWKNIQYKDGKMRTSSGGGGGASALTDLSDVNVSNPSDGQVLKYDLTTQKWKNENESGGGSVNDVTLDGNSVVNGQGVAILTTPNVNDLKDTNISNPSSGQTLQYNATTQKWENVTPASGGGTTFEIVTDTQVYNNDTTVILTLTKNYTNPYVFPVNCLPTQNWNSGARVVVQTGTISYDSTNNKITFKVYVSYAQVYNCDWMIVDLG